MRAACLIPAPIASQFLRCYVEGDLGVGDIGKIINGMQNYLDVQNYGCKPWIWYRRGRVTENSLKLE